MGNCFLLFCLFVFVLNQKLLIWIGSSVSSDCAVQEKEVIIVYASVSDQCIGKYH